MHRVLHSLGEELRAKVSAASTLAEMQAAHRMYMSTALKRCFLTQQVRRFQSKTILLYILSLSPLYTFRYPIFLSILNLIPSLTARPPL